MFQVHWDRLGLICPACRGVHDGAAFEQPLQLHDVFESRDGFILDGFLACSNAGCRAVYPIVRGVPIIFKDSSAWWQLEKPALTTTKWTTPQIRSYFERLEGQQVSRVSQKALLGTHMDAHYGSPGLSQAHRLAEKDIDALADAVPELVRPENTQRYGLSLDVGCSVGGHTFDLARVSELAIGIESHFDFVSMAAEIHRTGQFSYERKQNGRFFEPVEGKCDAPSNTLFLAADALDPPFSAESFDLVVALNVVDSVRLPLVLLGQIDALLRPGGTLVFGAPYAWNADICDPREWLESRNLDSPAMVRGILEGSIFPKMGLSYEVLRERDRIPWVLRHDDRYWSFYDVHLLKARKVH